MDSQLPELLRQAGHQVRSIGTHERLLPITEILKEHGGNNTITRQQVGVVAMFQFDLPSDVLRSAPHPRREQWIQP
jgi:hypothetical protein